jgi:2-oxoglutarate ferredoxin oxidoreductase subunit beta
VISPCVAFNNHPGSTKSYDYVREHNEAISRIDFISPREEITTHAAPGEAVDVRQHDGTLLRLRSLQKDYDPTDRRRAMAFMQEHQVRGEIVTGLLYVDPLATDLHTALNTTARPLNTLAAQNLCPGVPVLEKINASLR